MIPLQGTLIATAGAFLLGGIGGYKLCDAGFQRHLKKEAQQAAKAQVTVRLQEEGDRKVAGEVRDGIDTRKQTAQIVYRTIYEKVPVYVSPKTDIAFGNLPLGFVRLHNDSASASIAPTSGLDNDSPSGVSLSQLGGAITTNYGLCEARRIENEGWREWYRKFEARWVLTDKPSREGGRRGRSDGRSSGRSEASSGLEPSPR